MTKKTPAPPAPTPGELHMLAFHVSHSQERLKRGLRSALEALGQHVARASADLEEDRSLDEHLIQNASDIATLIARWNALLDLAPLVEVVTRPKK